MIGQILQYWFENKYETIINPEHNCIICNQIFVPQSTSVICDELSTDWQLTKAQRRAFDYREGTKCSHCGSSMRIQALAKTIVEVINKSYQCQITHFQEIPQKAKQLVVAEINNCQTLHPVLLQLPNLKYSEYGSSFAEIPSEDVTNLTYTNNTFDLVLMTDVLEHVPNPYLALEEIRRILKKSAFFVFTVPYLLDRRTKIRAKLSSEKKLQHIASPSFHGAYHAKLEDYLVFFEFGYDFIISLSKRFKLSIYRYKASENYINSVFVCQKV